MIQRAQIYADVKISTESDPGLKFRIFGLIWIRLSADLSMHYLVGISRSFRQVWYKSVSDCMRKILTKLMSKNPQWWRKWNVIRNSQADPDRHHKLITSRWSPLVHVCQVLSTSVTAFISYLVYSMIDGTITSSAWSVSVEDWVVEVPLDAGERSSCTSSYWASTFQHIKNAWARNHLAWAERLHFSHLWFSTL